jgi:hypothetical protein
MDRGGSYVTQFARSMIPVLHRENQGVAKKSPGAPAIALASHPTGAELGHLTLGRHAERHVA